MDFKDALRSIIKPHNEDPLERLTTPFGEALSKDKVLTEYPRPQFERPSYINLNGLWDYAIQLKKGFPVLLIAGKNDPVGEMGNGVIKLAEMYKGLSLDVKTVLYDGVRHEFLNDTSRAAAFDEIASFAEKLCTKK